MPDIQIPAWLVPAVLAIGWFVRKPFERRWAKKDRHELRHEADLEEQLQLLRHLNGDLRHKWEWLVFHEDAADLKTATPLANEIGTWCYKH